MGNVNVYNEFQALAFEGYLALATRVAYAQQVHWLHNFSLDQSFYRRVSVELFLSTTTSTWDSSLALLYKSSRINAIV